MANQQPGKKRPSENAPPSPSPSPSDEGAAASSPASAPVSPSEGAPGFIGDAGPEFNAEHATPPPAPEPEQLGPGALPLIQWEEDTVRALLTMKGRAMHAGIGVADQDWRYTEVDLAAIAPPLTRIANRYEPIQRLAVHADPLLLLFAFGGYGVRSLEERASVMRLLAEESDVEEIEPSPPGEVEGAAQQQAPTPPTTPRQTNWSTSVQGPPPPPAAVQDVQPVAPPRQGEAPINADEVQWEVPRQ